MLADLQGVDAVIIDMPYSEKFLPLLANLAAWADLVLAPDGVLAVVTGSEFLPDVFGLLGGYRPYRWTMCNLVNKQRTYSQVSSGWKPVLTYGGSRPFFDVIPAGAGGDEAKPHHPFGQDLDAFVTLVERLTLPGQTVVDPLSWTPGRRCWRLTA